MNRHVVSVRSQISRQYTTHLQLLKLQLSLRRSYPHLNLQTLTTKNCKGAQTNMPENVNLYFRSSHHHSKFNMLGTAVCMLFHFVAFSWMNYIYSQTYGAPSTNGWDLVSLPKDPCEHLVAILFIPESSTFWVNIEIHFPGADLGEGCRGCASHPEITCGFLIQLVFCKKKTMWFIGVKVEQETSAPLLK